jgi:hypothetical protein
MTVFGNRHGLEVVEQGLFVVFSDRGLRAVDAIVTFYRDRWLVIHLYHLMTGPDAAGA